MAWDPAFVKALPLDLEPPVCVNARNETCPCDSGSLQECIVYVAPLT